MKKTKILLICSFIAVFICILLTGCSKTERISSIDLKDNDPTTAIEMAIGKFDYEEYTLVVNYDSGSVKEIPLSEDMISELDRLKFYQPGDHVITVSYKGQTYEFKISVKRATFEALSFPENNVFTYDGSEHTVEIEGELPANASVSYIGGNTFVNAGSYDITAVVTCNGYVTERITTTVTIERAKYDVSGITFSSKEVVYDGDAHSIEISGQLPEGVSAPTYYINGSQTATAIDVGTYKIVAAFSNNNPNYDPIPNMETTLVITPADYSIDGVELIFKNENGEDLLFPWKRYDGSSVIFSVEDNGTLNNKVSVSYKVSDENGNLISESNIKTNIVNAGVYTVEVNFEILDNKNYNEIAPKTYTFEVGKAQLDTSNVYFESKIVEYNGKKHVLGLSLPPDLDTTKFDISYEYIRLGDDKVITENGKNVIGVSDAGEYTVRAVFTVTDPNYESIPSMQARLVVNQKTIPSSQFGFYNTTLTYTGEGLTPSFFIENTEHVSVSNIEIYKQDQKVDEAIDVGIYQVKITVNLADTNNYIFDNGDDTVEIVDSFTIQEAEIDTSTLAFLSNSSTVINQGDVATFGFNTKNTAPLLFKKVLYKEEDSKLISVFGPEEVTPDSDGMIYANFDTSQLEAGDYVFAIIVTPASSNYTLSVGGEIAEYRHEFMITIEP